uniref:Uncharacterized protein n=1 Tax=Nelumbo nucifera TaxID=4432 RepID=A0A822YGU0_NELNU|nr:TPA_asm: hypothetical protein HUJ06_010568 [Nelumbo nucifera]
MQMFEVVLQMSTGRGHTDMELRHFRPLRNAESDRKDGNRAGSVLKYCFSNLGIVCAMQVCSG